MEFFFSSRRRHTRLTCDWSSDVCSSDLVTSTVVGMLVPPGSTTVEVTLTEDHGETILRLRHTGLPTDAAVQFHSMGWNTTVDRLVIVAEGGNPGPYPFQEV